MKRTLKAAGFTLVEVTLAVGITGFGLIALLGLMPQGLNMARDSGNIMAELRIVQQLTGEIRSEEWVNIMPSAVAASASVNRCYDDQAIEVQKENENAAANISYVARVDFSVEAPRVPGAVNSDESLRRVNILIANVTDPGFAFTVNDSHRFKTYTVLIPQTSPAF